MNPRAVTQFDGATFDRDVLSASGPVLVDFHADWCQPCHALAPTIDAIAHEFAGRARIGKVNIDENQGLARQYDISSIPTVLVFKDGQVVRRFTGLTSRDDLAVALDAAAA